MTVENLGILDSAFLSGTFVGGGGINSQEILPRLSTYYPLIYFPKTSLVHNLSEDKREKLLDNIDNAEKLGIIVSSSFKNTLTKYRNLDNFNFQSFRDNVVREYTREIQNVKILYDNDFSIQIFPNPFFKGEMYELSKTKGKVKFGITLRGFGDINFNNNIKIILHILRHEKNMMNKQMRGKYMSLSISPMKERSMVANLIWNGRVDFVGYVNSFLVDLFSLHRGKAKLYDLFPADASRFKLDKNTVKNRKQIVFFGRLVPEKGIFEIPFIARRLKRMGIDCNIKVIGKFTFNHDTNIFEKLSKRLGVENMIEYLGFLPEEDMKSVIGESSIFVNPTHSDAYSIAMLEALSLRTVVVAYDNPFLLNLYKKVKAVSFVREFHPEAMAEKIAELLSFDERKIQELFDEETEKFVTFHSSYDVCADKIKSMIDSELG